MAAPEVADCNDQRPAVVVVAKRKLARLRPPAAVFSFGMCSEPASIEANVLIQWARYHDRHLPPEKNVASRFRATPLQIRGERVSGCRGMKAAQKAVLKARQAPLLR
jgi:hypothetical protein